MKTKAIMIISAIVVTGIVMAAPTPGDGTRAEFEAMLDNYIAECEGKAEMIGSSGREDIQPEAMLAYLKASFCRNTKQVLIRELVEKKIVPEQQNVDDFLNVRFYDILKRKAPLFSNGGPWDNHGFFK